MIQEPLWNLWSSTRQFDELRTHEIVDVAIIGGGITGISLAAKLKELGYEVSVLESRRIGKGTTGQSTGNLYEITEDLFASMRSKYGAETVKKVYAARREGMLEILKNINTYEIECDYSPQTMHLIEDASGQRLAREYQTAMKLGVDVVRASDFSFNFQQKTVLQLPGQAQFNPLLYTCQLTQRISGAGIRLYENSPVRKIASQDKDYFTITAPRGKITARYVVHATHTPKGKKIGFHSVLGPYREFGIAAKIKEDTVPEGIFWYYSQDNKWSFRKYTHGSDHFLVLVGKEYKVAQVNEEVCFKELKNFASTYFNTDKMLYQWGGQNYKPADHLPYIGELGKASNEFIATGFAADGLVYGSLAANIIANAIAGKTHPHASLFAAKRHRPAKASKRFIKENKDVVAHYLSNLFVGRKEISALAPGQGAVLRLKEGRVAVYKHPSGTIHKMSAKCPHMGCLVAWNTMEKSWDCTCHGSRFSSTGKFIEGPSWGDMEYLGLESENPSKT